MSVILQGFELANYRSFGPDAQKFFPLRKVNLFAGENNSGKSNVLRFLYYHMGACLNGQSVKLDRSLDMPRSTSPEDVRFGIARACTDEEMTQLVDSTDSYRFGLLQKVFLSEPFARGTDLAWVSYAISATGEVKAIEVAELLIKQSILTNDQWLHLWSSVTKMRGGDLRDWVVGVVRAIRQKVGALHSRVDLIPAIRQIGAAGSTAIDFGGNGIIDRLAQLQDPAHNEQHHRHSFEKICAFLCDITGNSGASLNVPYQRDVINVKMNSRVLPLDSLGTGIHEVIILAAAATLLSNQIVCIEEPELHLHPILERKLIRYLQQNTSNQYFITTHSPHVLDTPDCAVFHFRMRNEVTVVQNVGTSNERWELCRDLGCRATDIVQANCVVWVEGPSDRVYLNHWIRGKRPDLVEGVDYAIMFYGGRLLCHLSADDPEVNDFISLCALNRNIAIVIDSDRNAPEDVLNSTKTRIVGEVQKKFGCVWVTAGREVENYVAPSQIAAAVDKLKPGLGLKVKKRQFDKVVPDRGGVAEVNKVYVAKEVVANPPDYQMLDLNDRVRELIDFIDRANGRV